LFFYNSSISPNSTGFVNPNFISGNVPDHDDSLVDDLSEDQFIDVIQAIINKDEILRNSWYCSSCSKEAIV
jgi:hypothetical protein